MIAVLLPSRGRPMLANATIDNLYQTASEDIDILLALDDDDATIDGYDSGVTTMVTTRHGYAGLHHYYNALAAHAIEDGADYLLLWNDDARMLTDGWDRIVSQHDPSRPFVATPGGIDHPHPLVSRAFYDTLGHFSLAVHADTWVCEIGKAVGCLVSLDGMETSHLRDSIDDDNKLEGLRAQEEITLPLMQSDGVKALLAADVETMREALR